MDRNVAIARHTSENELANSHAADIPISVFLITLNEAAHIEQVLSSVAWADEVIVLDSGSTDGTTDICARMGVQLHHQEWLGYSAQKAAALAKCRNAWCLNIDGDEIVTMDLANELRDWSRHDGVSAVEIQINDLILGKTLHKLSRKRRIIRLIIDIAFPRTNNIQKGFSLTSFYFSKQLYKPLTESFLHRI